MATQARIRRWFDTDDPTDDAPTTGGRPRWTGPLLLDLVSALTSLVTSALGVGLGFAIVPGAHVDGPLPLLLIVVAIIAVDTAANPVLRRLAGLGGVLLALLIGVTTQIAAMTAIIGLTPGVTTTGWGAAALVLLVAGAVMTLGRWVVGTADSGYVVGRALERSRRYRAAETRRTRRTLAGKPTSRPNGRRTGPPDAVLAPRGLLVVQLDGVSPGVLRGAMASGQAPHLAAWIAAGTHRLSTWWSSVPSTTPAAMAGVLHGDDTQVPAFRWWDRTAGRMLASSAPTDARLIESRLRTGDGLLRGGGVAVSTTFTGGAELSLLVVSRAATRRDLGSGTYYVSFFSHPFLFPGALVLTVGEMVKELYQGHRQRVRGVWPRVGRTGAFVVLRGITNVVLRRLNLALVAEQMAVGRPIIFVDLVDYDEIAHHAGPERPEALRSLEGLDAVLGHLRNVAQVVGTDYELVVLSDHGQSLGSTFAQLTGRTLTEHVRDLMDDDSLSTVQHTRGEEWAPINALIGSVASGASTRPDRLVLGPDRKRARDEARPRRRDATDGPPDVLPDIAVIGSGNLGMVWFPRMSERPTLDDLQDRWPALVPGLALTEGIGAVMVVDNAGHPVVVGAAGTHHLVTSHVEGSDPLAPYGARAAHDLTRLATLPGCGDLVVLSTVDTDGQIHAFEDQVGSHGGIGGAQNEALLLHPADWLLDDALLTDVGGRRMIVGPAALHDQLLTWRRHWGAGPETP